MELRQERKERWKEGMSVVHGNKIQAHTHARASHCRNRAGGKAVCETVAVFYGRSKKKKCTKEQETREVTESAHVM